MKKLDVNDYSLAHLILMLLLHHLVKFEGIVWLFTTMCSYWYHMRRLRND